MRVRVLIDTLIVLMLVAILSGILWHTHQRQLNHQQQVQVHRQLQHLYDQIFYHGALNEADRSTAGFPLKILPAWFDHGLPRNPLAPPHQPWLDVAPDHDVADHPPDPVIRRTDQAGFWYNPNRGLFRVRVMPHFSEQQTLKQYNLFNGTNLTALASGQDTKPKPQPMPWSATIAAAPPTGTAVLPQTQAETVTDEAITGTQTPESSGLSRPVPPAAKRLTLKNQQAADAPGSRPVNGR